MAHTHSSDNVTCQSSASRYTSESCMHMLNEAYCRFFNIRMNDGMEIT